MWQHYENIGNALEIFFLKNVHFIQNKIVFFVCFFALHLPT